VSDVFASGAAGGTDLAEAVVEVAGRDPGRFRPLYARDDPAKMKMAKVARAMYGAHDVVWSKAAESDLRLAETFGYGALPLCVAKTQKSLTDDPKLLGRPEDFDITVRGVVLAAGAGYLVPLLGDMLRMPGLPAVPAAERIDLVDGRVAGLTA
jgi:formate--tetrahydrofolate ligase